MFREAWIWNSARYRFDDVKSPFDEAGVNPVRTFPLPDYMLTSNKGPAPLPLVEINRIHGKNGNWLYKKRWYYISREKSSISNMLVTWHVVRWLFWGGSINSCNSLKFVVVCSPSTMLFIWWCDVLKCIGANSFFYYILCGCRKVGIFVAYCGWITECVVDGLIVILTIEIFIRSVRWCIESWIGCGLDVLCKLRDTKVSITS